MPETSRTWRSLTEIMDDYHRVVGGALYGGAATSRFRVEAEAMALIAEAMISRTMRAPAKPKRVPPKTWAVDTDSEAFRAWFGQSTITDAEGKPRPMYHGTHARFTRFQDAKVAERAVFGGVGFYFTPNKEMAGNFGGIVMTCYLRMTNPLFVSPNDPSQSAHVAPYRREELEALGHDGIALDSDEFCEYVVFRPEQIRLIARERA